jgi:glycosyltransferase involved in cell wall biosynthesis
MAYFISASLFPSLVTPYMGLFVKHRLNALRELMPINTSLFVVSPTPYFPFKHDYFKHYSVYAKKPVGIVNYDGFEIAYPRYIQMPLTNSQFSGYFCYVSLKKYFRYFLKHYGSPQMLIAEYGFPDGLAVYALSKAYNIPFIVTLRGSDVSYFMRLPTIKYKMLEALNHAKAIIVVSHNMKQQLHDIFNISLEKITVIGNGVDSNIFYPKKSNIRDEFDIQTPHIICSVGGLIKRKNHALAIAAMPYLPHHSLLIVGTGEEYDTLKTQIDILKLQDRVFLLGAKPQEIIADIYSACDLFLLCSLSEGRPNVVLESLACGTPVLTSNVQGVNELITDEKYGKIIDMCDMFPEILSYHIKNLTIYPFDTEHIKAHGQGFSWKNCAKLYYDIIINNHI